MNPIHNRLAVLLLISAITYIAIHFIFGFSNYFSYKFLAIAILTVLASFAYLVESYKEYSKNAKELKEAKRILKANPTAEDTYFREFYNRI